MTKPKVIVLDYGSGNIRSAHKALEKAGAQVEISNDISKCESVAGLVIPGVGAFAHCVAAVRELGADRLIDRRLIASRPVFGICVGMQMMFDSGIEGGVVTSGLGQWPGQVTKLDAAITPHMGWNRVDSPSNSVLFKDLSDEYFYFVHSYAATDLKFPDSESVEHPAVSYTNYGSRFVSAVENGPLSAVQFHPEKSGDAGIQLLTNWIGTL